MNLTREYEVGSFKQFHAVLSEFRDTRWYFRGHASLDWDLVPKAGRPPFDQIDDRGNLEVWKRRAAAYTTVTPSRDWDWLALAQHHGFATRLLDWSINPLAAAFFAVDGDVSGPACVYAYLPSKVVICDRVGPFDFSGVAVFRPTAVVDRIVQQGGIFTVHGPATLPLQESLREGEALCRIVIADAYRRQLQIDLDFYYVNATALFPGLDGLSRYQNWYMTMALEDGRDLGALAG